MRKLFVLMLACLFVTGSASAGLADDSSYEYLLSTPTTWRITGGTLSNGAKYAVDSSSPETFALYMGHEGHKGNMYVIGDGVFEKEGCPYVKAKFEGMSDYARVVFGTSNLYYNSNFGGVYKRTAANTYSASFGSTVHDITSASLQIIDSSTITYTQEGPFVENDETVYTATLTLTRVTDGKSITEVNGLWRIAEGTLDGSAKYVDDEDSLPFNLSVSSFFDFPAYRGRESYELYAYGLGVFLDYEAREAYVKVNFEGVSQPAMAIWGTRTNTDGMTVTGLYYPQEDGTYRAGFSSFSSSVSYVDKAGFEIVDSSTIRYWQEGPFVKGSSEDHTAELILKRVEDPTFDFADLAGTWYASNETATATSGDLSSKMTLSAKHTNTITFKNINVSGDTATLESVSDIYMDIAGYDSEWEEDLGGYKSGVLEFKNKGGNSWVTDKFIDKDKYTSTIITIISATKLRVQRYDDYGVIFDVKYTLTRDVPQAHYETEKWEIANGFLTVQHTGSSSDLTYSPLDGTNGTGFHISGDLPANLTIHLPANWELDVDDGAKVTASDTSKVKQASEVDGLKYPAVKIFGSNDITLNESGIIMTAWYVPSTPSAEVETTSWTKQGSKLIVETNGTPSRYEFDALTSPDTNGDGFYLTGLPSGLKINLPFPWGIDIDTSYNVTVSDTSKIIPHTDIPGLPSTAHRIMGSNTITLNASDLRMTAFLFTAPTITTDSNLGSYKAGDTISKQLKVEGTDWTMKLTAENLPEGLSMTSEGLISGSIKTAGTYKFTVKAENCAGSHSRDFDVRITSGTSETLKITTTSLTDATEGQSYSFQLEADGSNLTWSAKTKLPDNLTLSESGLISGTPTTAGTYRVIFTVKNSSGATDSAALALKVKGSSSSTQVPKVKTLKMPDAFIGEEYSYQLEAEGTVDEWKLADGSTLPGGLDLNESNGEISGTVTESSAKTFKLKVIAVNEAGESKAQTVTIKVVAKTPYFKTEDLKSATWSKSYSFTMRLGNIKAETWSIEGDLPEGMKFEKGKFSGKPKEVGDFDLTITASNGASKITQDFTLRVAGIPPKFSGSFKTGTEGKYYECKLKAKGSTPIEWEFDSLPEGLTATPDATGEICIISGTPEEVFAQSVAITLTNGDNEGDSITAHKKLTIKAVKPKFETKAKDIPGGTVDETYSYQLALKANYTPSKVKWTYTGDMPAGLTLDEDSGEIYGVPKEAVKNSRFTVYAVNAAQESYKAKLNVTMTIKETEDTRLPVLGESPEGESESTAHEFVNGIAYYERGEITAENLANVSSSGEVIIATLPAVEVDAEDLYEFTVSVDKSAPEGGVLVWHSFPDGEYDGGDSEEAYFLDSNNTDIKTVPEDYFVTVHAWLKPGVIYEPVIAVKISHNN